MQKNKVNLLVVLALSLLAGCGLRKGRGDGGMSGMKMDTGMKGMAMDSMKMGHAAAAEWTCPMHPEVVRDKPGTCPVCGMDLVRKEPEARKVEHVALDDLLRPGAETIMSSVPLAGLRRETVSPVLEVLGTVAYDTRRISTISARVSGRIERLYVRYRFQQVREGQKIMDLYSPELAMDEQDLLFLLKNDPGNSVLLGAARERLRLLGVSEEQLNQVERTGRASATLSVYSNHTGHIHEAVNTMPGAGLADDASMGGGVALSASMGAALTVELPVKEGMYVEKGQTVFQVFNMDRSWAVLQVFPGDAGLVRRWDRVHVSPETAPGQSFDGRVDEVLPVYGKETGALTARVYFDNSRRDIPIGSQVKAQVQVGAITGDWLPETAVLSLGMDKVVFLRTAGGFQAHRVVTGGRYNGMIQALSGLGASDSVAANAQYLIDSDDFVKVKQ